MSVMWGYDEIELLVGEEKSFLYLAYPMVRPLPGKLNTFSLDIIEVEGIPSGIMVGWEFTDGVYSLTYDDEWLTRYPDITYKESVHDFPSDWNIEFTNLTLYFSHEPTEGGRIGLIIFDLFWGKIQYLPIMGMG